MNYILFLQAFRQKYEKIQNKQKLFQYVREELQYLILQALYTKMRYPIYFMGGTKLRLSYGLNRFSEDIDLALDKPDPNFPSQRFFIDITREFSKKTTGFQLESKLNTKTNVVKIHLSFSQILFDIGFSPLPSQTVKIKIELDINPPAHAHYEKKTYHSLTGDYLIQTHDLETGFAGKTGAILLRQYQKGRDYYDLQWYLQYRPKLSMNLDYLNANIAQQKQKPFKNEKAALTALIKKIKKLDLPLLRQDLERFVETVALLQNHLSSL